MEYYSAIKKNTFESVLMRWMKLEPIIQSEVSQEKKTPIQYAAAKLLQLCPTLRDHIDSSPPGFPSLGFSRQEYWSGVPYALVYCIGVFLSGLLHSV